MSDIPKVNPRNMAALLATGVQTHTAIRDSIIQAADERAAYYADRDKELNADARLKGRVKM